MPDIIEENEGEGISLIERRAQVIRAAAALQAAARARRLELEANVNNVNNINNNNRRAAEAAAAAVAIPEGNAVAENGDPLVEVAVVAGHMTQLVPDVDVRPMFRRLGVRQISDLRYIRERDLDGISRISPIQKRQLWAIIKYITTTDNTLTSTTTLTDIAKALNFIRKKERDESNPTFDVRTSSSSVTAALIPSMAVLTAGVAPMVHVTKLDDFDGSHSNWLLWKNKAKYALAQTVLGPLIQENSEDTPKKYADKYPGQDTLLFNMLAEAIVGGSARFAIQKAKKLSAVPPVAAAAVAETASNHNDSRTTKRNATLASGRVLWQLLHDEYSTGPRAFWILSDARQVLQKLRLVGPQTTLASADIDHGVDASLESVMVDESPIVLRDEAADHEADGFAVRSANVYSHRFRSAKETLEEFNQALPDAFLASTFVEHIVDERFDTIKKQLLQDINSKSLSLDECITEVLMTEYMLRTQKLKKPRSSNRMKQKGRVRAHAGRRKRISDDVNHDCGGDQWDDTKRRRLSGEGCCEAKDVDGFEKQVDETTSST